MRWETIKSREDLHISANIVTIEPDFIGDTLMGVAIRADGEVVYSVRKRGYDNIELVRPAGPEMIEAWVVSGKLAGLTVDGIYEHEHEAQEAIKIVTNRGGTASVTAVQFEKSKVRFNTVKTPASVASPDDEIPF